MMALDEPDTNNDITEDVGGMVFCMEKSLYETVGNVTIDLGAFGFQIGTERPYQAQYEEGASCSCGGSCGSGCSGGCH